MDVKHPVMVIGTGGSDLDRNLLLYDLSRLGPNMTPTTVLSQSNAPLKKQYRCVSIFPDKSGYAIGSIEGRVAIWYIDPSQQSKNFAFKCHRDKDLKSIYSVNAISFHPKFHTLSTAGGDGKWNFWDKDSKQRLKATNAVMCGQNRPLPITCSGFNNTGELFAYGVSYDWYVLNRSAINYLNFLVGAWVRKTIRNVKIMCLFIMRRNLKPNQGEV